MTTWYGYVALWAGPALFWALWMFSEWKRERAIKALDRVLRALYTVHDDQDAILLAQIWVENNGCWDGVPDAAERLIRKRRAKV